MRRTVIALIVVASMLPLVALAQGEVREADRVSYKKRTVVDFSDVTIEGELTKPEGSYLVNRKKTRFRNLIEVRAHFRPELNRTVNAL
ncbi:MAG: hypothetical protein ABIJ09_19790 [Pseudomonadota bacterium]